jgi:hypothetical protein
VQKLPLRLIYVVQLHLIGDGFNARLEGQDFIVTSHDRCLGIGSSDTQAEGSMTWMIFLAAFNGTLFQPLNHLPTFQSAEACYNFIALLNYKGDEHTRLICVPR